MDGNRREFVAEIHLQDGTVEQLNFPLTVSIDHMKKDIIRRSKKLEPLREDEKKLLQLGTLDGDVFDVEFVRFSTHEAVRDDVNKDGLVKLALRPQKEWAKHTRRSRRRGTVVGGPSDVRGLSFKEDKKFPIMLVSKSGGSVILFCNESSTIADAHAAALAQLRALVTDLERMGGQDNSDSNNHTNNTKNVTTTTSPTHPLFYPPLGVSDVMNQDTLMLDVPYISACAKCGNIPELYLSPPEPPAALVPDAAKEEPVSPKAEKEAGTGKAGGASPKEEGSPLSLSQWAKAATPLMVNRPRRVRDSRSFSVSMLPNLVQQRLDMRFTLPNGSNVVLKDIAITELLGGVKTKLWELIEQEHATAATGNTPSSPRVPPKSVSGGLTVGTTTIQAANSNGGVVVTTIPALNSISRYFVKVSHTHVYLTGETTPLYEFPVIKFCVKKGLTVGLTLVDKEESNKDKLISLQVGNILGRPLCWTHTETDETSFFRHKISKALQGSREKFNPAVAAKVTTAPLPVDISLDDILVLIHMPSGDGSRTLHCSGEERVIDLLQKLCRKSASRHVINTDPSTYFLRISGREEYVVHNVKLSEIEHVRECVKRRNKISFCMAPCTSVFLEDVPPEKLANGLMDPEVLKESQQPQPDDDSSSAVEKSSPKDDEQLESLLERELRVQGTASLFELKKPFEFKVVGLSGIKFTEEDPSTQIYVQAALYHGGEVLCEPTYTQMENTQSEPHWNQWLRSDILMCQLPKATRLCLTVYLRDGKSKRPLGWVNCQLFDYRGYMLTGVVALRMWPDAEANPIGTCVENLAGKSPPRLMLLFHEYPQPVVFPEMAPLFDCTLPDPPSPSERKKLKRIVTKDPLYQLGIGDKKLLWKYRGWLRSVSVSSLVKLLLSVPWTNPTAVREVHGLLALWGPIRPVDALELLDAKFADEKVRQYAVNCLRVLSDAELASYLLQLVQVLKYEPYHFSELALFLMERALKNRITIGHYFFWHLQAEMHVAEIAERYGLLIEAYLRGCGDQRDEIIRQMSVIKQLNSAAIKVKDIPMTKRKEHLQMLLGQLSLPDKFSIPLHPTMTAAGIIIDKCRCMDSAKVPLWVVFKNADPAGQPINIIFKSGDDLRQDLLTLQMLGIMDGLWKESGLDLHLTPYKCIATGEDMGMIEVVLESETTAAIQKAAGGATAAFQQTPLAEWLQAHNPQEDMYRWAVNNFIHSVGGYCVATYVLGIGDRHNDNIMVRKDGHLFHIDFGHFLGNFKKFMLYRREKAPFVLTPEFAFVMGGKDHPRFKQFIDLCCTGYNAIRHHANVFINLFAMMLSTGIPELTCEKDIDYLRDAFSLDLDDDDATEEFTKLIFESLNTKTTQINFFIHNLFHRN